MKKNLLFIIIGCMLVSLNATAAVKKLTLDEALGKTQFLAVGNPGFLKINGKGKGPKASLEIIDNKLNGTFEIDLASLDTGMALRNTHMKEKYLQIDKYPKAILTLKDQTLPEAWSFEKPELKSQKAKGILEIHGQKKPIEVSYNINKGKKIDAEFEMKISDFSIEIPSFMGVTVADKVKVQVESEIKDAK